MNPMRISLGDSKHEYLSVFLCFTVLLCSESDLGQVITDWQKIHMLFPLYVLDRS